MDANHGAVVQGLRALGYRVQSLAAVGQGVPDLLVGTPQGRLILVELKDGSKPPSKRRLTPEQVEWQALWNRWPVLVATSLVDLLKQLSPRADVD